jgi:hypothetical protein
MTKVADAENPDADTGGVEPFRALSEDAGQWMVRTTPNLSLDLYPAVVVKSLAWPGAVCVCKGAAYACIYIGYGQKHSVALYTPPMPPTMLSEYSAADDYKYEAPADDAPPAVAARPPLDFQQDVSVCVPHLSLSLLSFFFFSRSFSRVVVRGCDWHHHSCIFFVLSVCPCANRVFRLIPLHHQQKKKPQQSKAQENFRNSL